MFFFDKVSPPIFGKTEVKRELDKVGSSSPSNADLERLGRSAPRLGGSGPCIMKVEQPIHLAFLDKWIYFKICISSLHTYLCCYCLGMGECGNYCGCIQSLAPEERRRILEIGVPTCVPGRRVSGPMLL
jgi:hypothetical protein